MMFGHKNKTKNPRRSPEAPGGAGYGAGGEAVAADQDLKRRGEALLLAPHHRHTREGEIGIVTD